MRILVCGGRDYKNKNRIRDVLRLYGVGNTLIQGGAKGADEAAAEVAFELAWEVITYPAAWSIFGKVAGPMRNQKMLDEGQPDLVIAFAGGKGTNDMVARALEAGIYVREFDRTT